MILSCQNISKAFVENQVLKNVSFHIEDHEKAAIVGINGAGKTTLLRIIVGEMTPDDGQVVLAKDKTLGYLAQNSTVDTSHTIYEELLSVKADLLRLEEKIRECENNMKHADGDALEDLIEAANGQPVLIAYWFKHDRQRIGIRLAKMGLVARNIKESQDIKDWNEGRIPVALIHPASAGHGLNIQQGGHILIWFGLTWSLELYQQTNARLWRQGQRETVTIHHIICKDTVDEDVMAALEQKDITQEKLISAVKARLY